MGILVFLLLWLSFFLSGTNHWDVFWNHDCPGEERGEQVSLRRGDSGGEKKNPQNCQDWRNHADSSLLTSPYSTLPAGYLISDGRVDFPTVWQRKWNKGNQKTIERSWVLFLVSLTFPLARSSPNRVVQIIPSHKLQEARGQGEVWAAQVPQKDKPGLGRNQSHTIRRMAFGPLVQWEGVWTHGDTTVQQSPGLCNWLYPTLPFPRTPSPALKSPNGKVPSLYVYSWLSGFSRVQIGVVFVKLFLHNASVSCPVGSYAWSLPSSFLL